MTTPQAPEPFSPLWWVERLYERLRARQDRIDRFDAYYRGDHPLPWLAPQAQSEFRRILQMTRSNYMGLVVDSKAERIQVEGFRVGKSDVADTNLWRIWQANDLDSDSDLAFLEALIGGESYLLVAPNPDDRATPLVTVEHATQAVLAYEPGSRRKVAAGLKVWADDWTGDTLATLYLPTRLFKYRARNPRVGVAARFIWEPREAQLADGERNPLGQVPLVELAPNPRMLAGGQSVLEDLTDIQDRINKTLADRLMTQDFGAFPQRWAAGWPLVDDDGNPTPAIEVARDRMVTTDVPGVTFGQWQAAPLDPYSAAKREDVKDIASRSRTPAQYLLGEMSNVNGETLKASEAGHIAVVRQFCRHLADGLERAMRLAQQAAGLAVDPAMETLFRNPEFRTEGELADATVKKLQAGIINVRQAREDLGYSAAQIARLQAEDAEGDAFGALTRLLDSTPAPAEP